MTMQWLIEALSQEHVLDSLVSAAPPDLGVHLRQRPVAFGDSEQRVKIGQRVLHRPVQNDDLAGDFFTALPCIIFGNDSEVITQQLDHRQIGRGLAVRYRVGFQHQCAALGNCLELMEEPRLADVWFADRRDDLAVAISREAKRILHLLQLAFAADELGKSAPDGPL
jgi:hypothetical protein